MLALYAERGYDGLLPHCPHIIILSYDSLLTSVNQPEEGAKYLHGST
jgi:hypothetical protein